MGRSKDTERETARIFRDEAATAAFAGRLSSRLRPGDCLLLSGEIGAGKSVFARAAIQAMMARAGAVEDVPSPTFTLVQAYAVGAVEVWHADLYRLSGADEADELGLAEAFETAITFVEWPDRLGDAAPGSALCLDFRAGAAETERRVRLRWRDPRWDFLTDPEWRDG